MAKQVKISQTDFWHIVSIIGWGKKTTDHKAVNYALLKRWPKRYSAAVREVLETTYGRLEKKVNSYLQDNNKCTGLGDDSYSDLLYHVIGLGRKSYNQAMKDPSLVYDRGRKEDFKECFAYCLPMDMDYNLSKNAKNPKVQLPGRYFAGLDQ